MKMAYTNEVCGAPAINSAELLGRMALSGMIIASNASCTVENEDCVAELTSSDTGIFYDVLQIISTQVDPLSFSFTHSVVVCGVDVALLAPAITIETMQVFGNNHFCPFPISLAKFQVRASQSESERVRACQSESERGRVCQSESEVFLQL